MKKLKLDQPDTGSFTHDDLHQQPREELSKKRY